MAVTQPGTRYDFYFIDKFLWWCCKMGTSIAFSIKETQTLFNNLFINVYLHTDLGLYKKSRYIYLTCSSFRRWTIINTIKWLVLFCRLFWNIPLDRMLKLIQFRYVAKMLTHVIFKMFKGTYFESLIWHHQSKQNQHLEIVLHIDTGYCYMMSLPLIKDSTTLKCRFS